jgi:5-formyltetrahydrofolate cyclo-ligase
MSLLSRKQLRAQLRRRRQSISQNDQTVASEALATLALSLPQWESAQKIALYAASDGEIDTTAIAQYCFTANVQVFLPIVGDDKQMVFAQWQQSDKLSKNHYGIAEPAPHSAQQPLSNMDIIFMPLVAWDKAGNRLGMGGGYYDRALANHSGRTLIGLAHQMQEVAALPQQNWDVSLDMVITDREIYYCKEATAREWPINH